MNGVAGLDSAYVASRLRTVFQLELRHNGVPVESQGTAPQLRLGVDVIENRAGTVAYSSVATLVDDVFTRRAVSTLPGEAVAADSAQLKIESYLMEHLRSVPAAVWQSSLRVGTTGPLQALNDLEDRTRGIAQEFANAWLAAH